MWAPLFWILDGTADDLTLLNDVPGLEILAGARDLSPHKLSQNVEHIVQALLPTHDHPNIGLVLTFVASIRHNDDFSGKNAGASNL